MRSSKVEITGRLLAALAATLEYVGLDGATLSERSGGVHAVLDVAGSCVAVEVRQSLRSSDAYGLTALRRLVSQPLLIAAERVPHTVRVACVEAGINYFDSRGRLRLVLPGVFVDAEVPPTEREPRPDGPSLSPEVAKEVALSLLAERDGKAGTRELARRTGRSPSGVSAALSRLRRDGLVTAGCEAVIPDLFWELAGQWRPARLPVDSAPGGEMLKAWKEEDGDGHVAMRAALTGRAAAERWGLPIREPVRPDYYVADAALLAEAATSLRRSVVPEDPACTVARPPARFALWLQPPPGPDGLILAHPVVVALDLAAGGHRELLNRWNPSVVERVW